MAEHVAASLHTGDRVLVTSRLERLPASVVDALAS